MFGDGVLSAGHGITLWDLETKTAKRNFTGHPSLITQLEIIPDTDYFVTMCHTERHLRIWYVFTDFNLLISIYTLLGVKIMYYIVFIMHFCRSSNEKNSVLTLTVPEPPQSFSVFNSEEGHVSIASVTQKGPLHLFKHKLNGPVKKPLLPSVTLKVHDVMDANKSIPVLASFVADDGSDKESSIVAAYGSWLRLRFEKFSTTSLETETVIEREYSTQKRKGKKQHMLMENDTVEIPSNVKHLQPGSESLVADLKSKKRKKVGQGSNDTAAVDDGELPMEERLTNLTIDAPASGSVPSSSNLANLLSQVSNYYKLSRPYFNFNAELYS